MIAIPLNYEGPSYPVMQFQMYLGEWLNDHQTVKYLAYEDWPSGNFICEMTAEDQFAFILKHPQYQHYVQT